jgi:hypothetical protein
MRNVSYLGLCWAMTLGLVAVALGQQQQPAATWQEQRATGRLAVFAPAPANVDARQSAPNPQSNFGQPAMPAPNTPQDRSLMTSASQSAQPAMNGQQPRGELGVWMAENDGPGVRILRVTPGSAAEQAGLRVGDFVLQINGRGASSPQGAAQMIRQIPIGQTGTLTIWRDGDQQQLRITMQAARDRGRDLASDMGRETDRGSYQVGFHDDERSTGGDSSSRIMRLEQQIGSLTHELATIRQELTQLRSAGSVQTTGFNADVNQGSTPLAPPAQAAAPSSPAAPASSTNTVGPPPGFGKVEEKATNSVAEPPKSAAPTSPPAGPAKSATPASPAEKPAASDLFGSDSAQPKNAEKPKAEDKKAGDKGATDDLFK